MDFLYTSGVGPDIGKSTRNPLAPQITDFLQVRSFEDGSIVISFKPDRCGQIMIGAYDLEHALRPLKGKQVIFNLLGITYLSSELLSAMLSASASGWPKTVKFGGVKKEIMDNHALMRDLVATGNVLLYQLPGWARNPTDESIEARMQESLQGSKIKPEPQEYDIKLSFANPKAEIAAKTELSGPAVRVEDESNRLIVRLARHRFDNDSDIGLFGQVLKELPPEKEIQIDFKEVEFVESTFVNKLFDLFRRLGKAKCKEVLLDNLNPKSGVYSKLNAVKILSIFKVARVSEIS